MVSTHSEVTRDLKHRLERLDVMAMDGKDFALLGIGGALAYVIYQWYQQQGTLAGLLPCSTNATGQTNASAYPGGVYNQPYFDGYGMIPTTVVIQPSMSTPAPSSTPVVPGATPSPTAPAPPAALEGQQTIRLPHMVATPLVGPSITGMGDLSTGQLAAFRSLINLPQYKRAYSRYTLMGLGSISPSMGFGVRRTGNIFPLGSEKRIVY